MESFLTVNENCNGCLACVHNCPSGALKYEDGNDRRVIFHNMALCARCGHCRRVCPENAVELRGLLEGPWAELTSLEVVHCEVCGEPVHTASFSAALERRLGGRPAARCPKHRDDAVTRAWKPYRGRGEVHHKADMS